MIIHVTIHGPDEVNMNLWPFVIHYSAYLWNTTPRGKSMMSPEELFYDGKSDHQEVKSAKVFGCNTYVLYPKIHDGNRIPWWSSRSEMVQFLGYSVSYVIFA